MLGIFFALCVSLLKSLSELSGKIFTQTTQKKSSLDEYSLAFGIRLYFAILQLPLLFFIEIPQLSLSVWGALIVVSLINALTTVSVLKSVKYGDLSLVSPLSSFTLPFLLCTGYIFLWEVPNVYGFIGVLIIFMGTYLLQVQDIWKGLFAPIRTLIQNPGARYMLLTSLLWSISAPLDKLGIIEIGIIPWIMISNILICIILATVLLFLGKQKSFFVSIEKQHIKKITLYALVTWLGLVFQFLALKYLLAAYVIAIKRASGMFSVVLWKLVFHEKYIFQRLLAAGIIFLWVVCIILAWNI